MTVSLRELDALIAKEEAAIMRFNRILHWLDRYDPIDWSLLIIAAMVVWAALV